MSKKNKKQFEYDLFRNGSIHSTFMAANIREARSKVRAAFGPGKYEVERRYKNEFEDGDKLPYQVVFYDKKNPKTREIIDSEYYNKKPSEKEVDKLMKELGSKFSQCYFDKHNDDNYIELIFEQFVTNPKPDS